MSAMYHKTLSALSIAAVLGFAGYTPVAQAFNFGDMMNPGRWMGGDRDRYDDDYYDGPYGGGPWGGPGYGYGGYPGFGGYPGYGGFPGYGYGGYPGAGYGFPGYGAAPAAAPAPAAPATAAQTPSGSAGSSEIDALKRRIEELEAAQKPRQRPAEPGPAGDWPASPAFRPMNQY